MKDAIAIQSLKTDIQNLRQHIWPPQHLAVVEGLPIYYGVPDQVESYYKQWVDLIERAKDLYEPIVDEYDEELTLLPNHLNLPLFFFHVDRIRINKTRAKESKSFRSIASLTEKCGEFELAQVLAMKQWLINDDQAVLVAHREFIDLRTYVFQFGQSDYTRTRFYTNGIILSTEDDFKLIDAREKPRKQRSDSYQDALADNGTWKVFGKIR